MTSGPHAQHRPASHTGDGAVFVCQGDQSRQCHTSGGPPGLKV